MSQPGILDVEFVWPQTTAIVIYDSSKVTIDQILAASKDQAKRELAVINDQPFH